MNSWRGQFLHTAPFNLVVSAVVRKVLYDDVIVSSMPASHLIVWEGIKQMTVYRNGFIRAEYFLLIVLCCYIYMCCSSSNGFRAQRQPGRPRSYLSCLLMLAAGEKANHRLSARALLSEYFTGSFQIPSEDPGAYTLRFPTHLLW